MLLREITERVKATGTPCWVRGDCRTTEQHLGKFWMDSSGCCWAEQPGKTAVTFYNLAAHSGDYKIMERTWRPCTWDAAIGHWMQGRKIRHAGKDWWFVRNNAAVGLTINDDWLAQSWEYEDLV